MNELTATPEWYKSLVDDCRAIVTEAVFTSRWSLVEGYHLLGKRILEESKNGQIDEVVQDLAQSLGRSRRTFWYAVQFARRYPKLEQVPEGKNISWNKVVTKYLPESQTPEEKPHEHEWVLYRLCKCGKKEIVEQ